MPQTIVAVEEEGECKESLEANLNSKRPSSNGSHHRLRLEVPASVRSNEVGYAEEVERSGENDGGQAVETRGVPGDLRLVDGEMRGDGAVETLFGEDLGVGSV